MKLSIILEFASFPITSLTDELNIPTPVIFASQTLLVIPVRFTSMNKISDLSCGSLELTIIASIRGKDLTTVIIKRVAKHEMLRRRIEEQQIHIHRTQQLNSPTSLV